MKKSTAKTFRQVVRVIKINEEYSGSSKKGPYTLRSMFCAPVESATPADSDDLGIRFSSAESKEGEAYNALTFRAPALRSMAGMGSGDFCLLEGIEKPRSYYSHKEGKQISSVDVEFFSISNPFRADKVSAVIKKYVTGTGFERGLVAAGCGVTAGIVAQAQAAPAHEPELTPAEKGALTKAKNKAAKLAAKSAPAQPTDVDDIPF